MGVMAPHRHCPADAGSASTGCADNGVCGTIVFLGKIADLRQAVFLSQTTTPGPCQVAAAEGSGHPDAVVASQRAANAANHGSCRFAAMARHAASGSTPGVSYAHIAV
jgi:hypothetical protein